MSKEINFSQAKEIDLTGNEKARAAQAAIANRHRAERKALRVDCLHLVAAGGFASNAEDAIKEAKKLMKFVIEE